MYFSQIRRNAAKNRKDNGLFFGSLIVAIVAFYTLLSLEQQDVMIFLKTMESDAIAKLMQLIPYVYIVSLFFVFFLVYFAYRYQLDKRKREFGLYLMLGMKRGRLWAMLMGETLLNSVIALLIGIPVALFLTEAISLLTAKLVGIGMIGHTISFSLEAVGLTALGFFIVQLVSMLFLSGRICRQEPLTLLNSDSPQRQSTLTKRRAWIYFVLGILFLGSSYAIGVIYLRSYDLIFVGLVLLFVGIGTFLTYRSLGAFIGNRIKRKAPNKTGLFIFTGRQVQENVLSQHKTMAVSSLLLLLAIACVSFGIGTAAGTRSNETRSVDFSITGDKDKVRAVLDSERSQELIATYYPMYLSMITYETLSKDDPNYENGLDTPGFSWDNLLKDLEAQPESEGRRILLHNLQQNYTPYLIQESSYNALLESNGEKPLNLGSDSVAFFSSINNSTDYVECINRAIEQGATIELGFKNYPIVAEQHTTNVVADQKISLLYALIVPDEVYEQQAQYPNDILCWNATLKEEVVQEKGLVQALMAMDENLTGTGLEYESYITGIGRNLFYTVGASYLTIYLGVLFTVIANTVIGLKFLMQQRENRHRYQTLLTLGARITDLCRSAKTQIQIFFGLVLSVAAFSSLFAIWSLFTSFLKLPANVPIEPILICAGVALVVFIGIECAYVFFIGRASDKEIRSLSLAERNKAL